MLYHIEIGIPKTVKTAFGTLKCQYSRHAEQAAITDRYGMIQLPLFVDTNVAQVIEVETAGPRTVKVLYRLQYDNVCDLVVAMTPDGFVKTVWLNKKTDTHRTLDRSKYARATA